MTAYEVRVAMTGYDGWGLVYIPELEAMTQYGNGYAAEDMAREVISLMTDIPESDIQLTVERYQYAQPEWWR